MTLGGYRGKGTLYQAIKDFKLMVAADVQKHWHPYWREFAEQAFADLVAYEMLMREA